MVGKDLGTLSQTLLRKLLERSFLRTFKNFKQGDFRSLPFVCADFGVAVCRATNSGCSEPHSASEMRTFSLSPLPDRNGRKLHLNRAERHAGRSVSWGRYIPMGSANLSPSSVAVAPASPQGEAFCKSPFALHNKAMSGSNMVRPHQSPTATASPQGEAFLQNFFRTTQQGDG